MSQRENPDDFMRDISKTLASEVSDEMKKDPTSGSYGTVLDEKGASARKAKAPKKKKKKKKKGMNGFVCFLLILLIVIAGTGIFVTQTKTGRAFLVNIATDIAYLKMQTKDDTGRSAEDELAPDGELVDNIDLSAMSDTFRQARHEEGVTNILLLGVEAIGFSDGSGHTDAIMIATLNENENTMGVTSLMRDSWVYIPDYGYGRINTAYAVGGVPLLMETIAENYNLRVDGYALVGFEAFEAVIDALGGVDIKLTAKEAKYLNTTNYISKKENRTMVKGMNHMNGNQALGYCRVRKVKTIDGSANDMGRTSRQRRVIAQIQKKIATANPVQLVTIMNTVLPMVETDVVKNNAKIYLQSILEMSLQDIPLDSLRLPEDGGFDDETINGAMVIVPHWDDTIRALHTFVFEGRAENETDQATVIIEDE